MSKRITNKYFLLMFCVISLVLAGMSTNVMAQAENGKPAEPANKYLGEGGHTIEYIVTRVNAAGFTDVYSVVFEHDLYNIKARHPDGGYVEIQLDPASGALVKDPKTGKPRYQTVSGKSDSLIPSWKNLITQIKAAGYTEVYTIEYEHAVFEIIARDAQNHVIELWANPNTGELLRHPETGKPLFEILE